MNGEDFKILVKSAQLNETEVGNLLGCTRENVFKIYKKQVVKNAYIITINNYIKDKNIQKSQNSYIEINNENEVINPKTNVNIVKLEKDLERANDVIDFLRDYIKKIQLNDFDGGQVYTNTKGDSKRPRQLNKKTSKKN